MSGPAVTMGDTPRRTNVFKKYLWFECRERDCQCPEFEVLSPGERDSATSHFCDLCHHTVLHHRRGSRVEGTKQSIACPIPCTLCSIAVPTPRGSRSCPPRTLDASSDLLRIVSRIKYIASVTYILFPLLLDQGAVAESSDKRESESSDARALKRPRTEQDGVEEGGKRAVVTVADGSDTETFTLQHQVCESM